MCTYIKPCAPSNSIFVELMGDLKARFKPSHVTDPKLGGTKCTQIREMIHLADSVREDLHGCGASQRKGRGLGFCGGKCFFEEFLLWHPDKQLADYSSKPALRQHLPHLNGVFMEFFHCNCLGSSHPVRIPFWETTGSDRTALLHRTALRVVEETGDFHPESLSPGETSPAPFPLRAEIFASSHVL